MAKQRPDYYCGEWFKEGVDPEVTCWHCKRTFLCDCMDATCRLCGAPFDKSRCKEFNFIPKLDIPTKIIDRAIMEIGKMKIKYSKYPSTMFIYKALDEVEKTIGWNYAKLLEENKR